jgi:hypothetical protein
MTEGTMLKLNNTDAKARVTRIISNQAFIIECTDKRLSFTRLVDPNDIADGLAFSTWANVLKRN